MGIDLFNILSKGAMRLADIVIQPIYNNMWTVLQFNVVTMDRGDITCDPNDNSISILNGGLCQVTIGVNGVFPGAKMLEVMVFIDGVPYSDHPLVLQGRANGKPVSLFWQSIVVLPSGSKLDIRARNGDSGSFDLELHRMYFSISREH